MLRFRIPKTLTFLLALAICLPGTGVAAGSSVSKKLNKLADRLTKVYTAKKAPSGKVSLAVLPFNTSVKLARQNVAFAFSELLTQAMLRKEIFRLIERTQLNNVLEEQKLQQSGAIDSESAVKVGKVMGVETLIMGRVDKVGKRYQLNARLVEVESGEILAAEFEEFPAHLFEEEAKDYLRIVPRTQKIGVYVAHQFGLSSDAGSPSQLNVDWFSLTRDLRVKPEAKALSMTGAGIRYYPGTHFYLDAALFFPKNFEAGHYEDHTYAGVPGGTIFRHRIILKPSDIGRGLIGYSANPTGKFGWSFAAGAIHYNIAKEQEQYTPPFEAKLEKTFPTTRLTVEYKPQPRIGLSLNVNYTFGDLDITIPKANNAVLMSLSPLSIEPTLSIYF